MKKLTLENIGTTVKYENNIYVIFNVYGDRCDIREMDLNGIYLETYVLISELEIVELNNLHVVESIEFNSLISKLNATNCNSEIDELESKIENLVFKITNKFI